MAQIWAKEGILLCIFCLVVVFQLWVWRDRNRHWWIVGGAAVLVATGAMISCLKLASAGLPLTALAVLAAWLILRLVLLSATASGGVRSFLGLVLFTKRSVLEEQKEAEYLAAFLLLLLSLLAFSTGLANGWLASWSGDAVIGLAALAPVAAALLAFGRYSVLFIEDTRLGPGNKSEENFWAALLMIVAVISSTVLATIDVLDAARPAVDINAPNAASAENLGVLAGMGALSSVLALLAASRARPTSHRLEQESSLRDTKVRVNAGAVALAVPALAVWAITPWVLPWLGASTALKVPPPGIEPHGYAVGLLVFAVLVSAWIGYTTSESIYSNIAEIEYLRFAASAWLISVAAGVTTAATGLWLLALGLWGSSGPVRVQSAALALAIIAFGNLVVMSCIGLLMSRSWPRVNGSFPYMALHHAATNIFHDHFLQGVFLSFSVTAAYLVGRTAGPATGIDEWIVAVLKVSFPFVIASAFAEFVIRGGKYHVATEGRDSRALAC